MESQTTIIRSTLKDAPKKHGMLLLGDIYENNGVVYLAYEDNPSFNISMDLEDIKQHCEDYSLNFTHLSIDHTVPVDIDYWLDDNLNEATIHYLENKGQFIINELIQ